MPVTYTFTTLNDPASKFPLPDTVATGVDSAGNIVGYTDQGSELGFLYSNGAWTTLDDPSSNRTIVQGINDSGQFVGYIITAGHHGFVNSGGTYTALDVPTAIAGTTLANGINASGQIVGTYTDHSGEQEHGFLYSGGTWTA